MYCWTGYLLCKPPFSMIHNHDEVCDSSVEEKNFKILRLAKAHIPKHS